MSDIQEIIFSLPNILIPIISVYAIKNYLQLHRELKIFSWFILFSLCIQIPSYIFGLLQINNLFFLHFYVPLSFFFLTLFYESVFQNFINKIILRWIMILFVLFSIINSIFWQDLLTFNSYALSLESALIVIYSLSLFSLLLNQTVRKEKQALLASLIWINSGLFIYHTSGLLLFYFGELLIHFTSVKFRISWLFHSFIYLVMLICFIIGLWKRPKK